MHDGNQVKRCVYGVCVCVVHGVGVVYGVCVCVCVCVSKNYCKMKAEQFDCSK